MSRLKYGNENDPEKYPKATQSKKPEITIRKKNSHVLENAFIDENPSATTTGIMIER